MSNDTAPDQRGHCERLLRQLGEHKTLLATANIGEDGADDPNVEHDADRNEVARLELQLNSMLRDAEAHYTLSQRKMEDAFQDL